MIRGSFGKTHCSNLSQGHTFWTISLHSSGWDFSGTEMHKLHWWSLFLEQLKHIRGKSETDFVHCCEKDFHYYKIDFSLIHSRLHPLLPALLYNGFNFPWNPIFEAGAFNLWLLLWKVWKIQVRLWDVQVDLANTQMYRQIHKYVTDKLKDKYTNTKTKNSNKVYEI